MLAAHFAGCSSGGERRPGAGDAQAFERIGLKTRGRLNPIKGQTTTRADADAPVAHEVTSPAGCLKRRHALGSPRGTTPQGFCSNTRRNPRQAMRSHTAKAVYECRPPPRVPGGAAVKPDGLKRWRALPWAKQQELFKSWAQPRASHCYPGDFEWAGGGTSGRRFGLCHLERRRSPPRPDDDVLRVWLGVRHRSIGK